MLRSLFSGVSGLRSHQAMMDVVGNNIANVNTAGFKSSQTVFEDTLSQMLQGAGAPTASNGGTNPAQVGLGVRLAGVSTNFTQGATQMTGHATDLMIQGDGFFVIKQGGEQLYTRAGSFTFDATGRLVTPDGGVVQGWVADATGKVNTNATVADIKLPLGSLLSPSGTKGSVIGGNLPGDAAVGSADIVASDTFFDAAGNKHNALYTFAKTASGWDLTIDVEDGTPVTTSLVFDSAGKLTTPAAPSLVAVAVPWLTAPATLNVDVSKLSNFGSANTIVPVSQDGYGMGSLSSFSIGPDGTIMGVYTNGLKQPLGQIALASFDNAPGLEKAGGSLFRPSVNSGNANIGSAGGGRRGLISGGALEMSNVDLAQEFTNLIIAQRGFQANSRVITSSDEILQDLVNLKR